MKKLFIVFFMFVVISVSGFADLFISPTFGFSNILTKGKTTYSGLVSYPAGTPAQHISISSDATVSWTPFTFGLDMGYFGKTGFTFMFNNHFSTLGNIKYLPKQNYIFKLAGIRNAESKKLGGITWNSNLLFAYTYKGVPNLFITFGSGLAGSFGKISTRRITMDGAEPREYTENQYTRVWNIGSLIHFGIQYYFTNNIGINFVAVDTIGYGEYINYAKIQKNGNDEINVKGLSNSFTLKIGPSFKF